jgi:hypothetical protein
MMDLPPDAPRYRRWDDEPPVYGNASPLRRLLSFPFSVSVATPRPSSSLASSEALPATISSRIEHVLAGD